MRGEAAVDSAAAAPAAGADRSVRTIGQGARACTSERTEVLGRTGPAATVICAGVVGAGGVR